MTLSINFLVFISVSWAVHYLFRTLDGSRINRARQPIQRSESRPARGKVGSGTGRPDPLRVGEGSPPIDSVFSGFKLTRMAPYFTYLQQKLLTARWTTTPETLISRQILTGMVSMILAVAGFFFLQNGRPGLSSVILLSVLFFIVGLAFPLLYLLSAVEARQKNMVKDLSYYLDLMTLGVEAGLDYLMVLARVMENSKMSPLKEELEAMVRQVRMGKSRSDAWREFSSRINLPEIHSMILVFVQTDQIGSPLSAALRQLSDEIKIKRFQLAEKRAYQMPVKMLIPLLGCIFPAVFIIIFEPLILRLLKIF